jgi:hypothetical protein
MFRVEFREQVGTGKWAMFDRWCVIDGDGDCVEHFITEKEAQASAAQYERGEMATELAKDLMQQAADLIRSRHPSLGQRDIIEILCEVV